MNQIETNVVEFDASELESLTIKQAIEAISELNACQLALVGGGNGVGILD